MDGHEIEQPEMFVVDSHHKRLWLVPPEGQPPDGFFPGALLEFRLTPSRPGKAVQLTVFRRGQFSLATLGEREFANPMLAAAFVQAEVERYQARGWTLRSDPPPHTPASQIVTLADGLDASHQPRPVTALTPRARRTVRVLSKREAHSGRRE
jgi:hypothetical protein